MRWNASTPFPLWGEGYRRINDWIEDRTRPAAPPPHLTQSIALEESPLPHLLRAIVVNIGALLSIFLLWAALTSVEEIASASGQVIPSGYVQAVQHLEGGIVKEIIVHEGDLVEKGQPLIRLDNTSAGADLGQMQAREKSLKAQAERLRQFTQSEASGHKMTKDEQAILNSMEESRDSQRRVITDQIAQKEKELKAFTATRTALEKNMALMEKENTIKQNLAKKGYGSELMALTSQRDFNQMEGTLEEARQQEQAAQDALNEAKSRMESLNADLKSQAMKNLGETEAQIAEVNKSLEKFEGTANRTLVLSPVRGIVKGLNVHTIGAVAEQGKVLLEIVPIDEELMVEAMVLPDDVGHLKPAQTVKVKVSAFDFSRYGSVAGTLGSVSASTFQAEDGKSFYKARIKLEHPYVGDDPKRNLIMPGMTVQADIVTGEKSVLRYLLKPIYVAAEGAFHEH